MRRVIAAILGTGIVSLVLVADQKPRYGLLAIRPIAAHANDPAAPRPSTHPTTRSTPLTPATSPTALIEAAASPTPLIEEFCETCHDDEVKRGGLTLQRFDASRAELNPDIAEKMIRKLRAGLMPPPGNKRPDAPTMKAFVAALETRIDEAAAIRPNPGRRPFQRLNRAEYARVVRDLLVLDVDVNTFLPPDTVSHGFDNISDEQPFSSTLMEGYLRAAGSISRLAVGERDAGVGSTIYKVARTGSQMRQVEGAPIGTRGGISLVHTFPADGDYTFRMLLHMGPTGDLFGTETRGEQIEVSINGEAAALLDINPTMKESDPNGTSLQTPPIRVQAGPQRVSAAFIQRADGPIDDVIAPIEHTLADTNVGEVHGITALPHLRDFTISGPHRVTGVSETPSRRKIFTCRPTAALEEATCAGEIIKRLAREAYRGHVSDADHADLMRFYGQGRKTGDFESGIRLALQFLLANPRFLLRLERSPNPGSAGVPAGGTPVPAGGTPAGGAKRAAQTYRVSDLDLASRLSFFLWGTAPDAELVGVARQGTLGNPNVLEKQARRMLADPRSEALATRFAAQWLRLQDVDKVRPDPLLFPHWDQSLTTALQRETELFFDSLVREDRSVLDLIAADYTFVNERLAKHYRLSNVMGNEFRRVQIPDENRRGILGQGSILLLTSVADRTSPVLRGKWVMEVLLGTPPPQPPPDVPDLDATSNVKDARLLSVRERMEEHRTNPTCNSCHRVIDPLGLALENFDATGAWRIKDNGVPIDATGVLYDGTMLRGPSDLRQALLKRSDVLLLSFTESLMTYALGRSVEYFDMPAVRAIVRDAARHDNRISSFILGIVNSAAFRTSAAEQTETTVAGGPAEPPR